ncbi:MAG TPA: hypothetical protein VKJ07_19560, partial [Mycobacteriales bacterium]|nr:hypothetical protein [Mycobacteriales bacterium]
MDISSPLAPRLAATVADNAHLHKTTGLDVDPSATHVVATSPYLASQTQPLYPPYALQPGGPTMTGTVSSITLDPSPIAVSISPASEPANPTAQTTAGFTFTVNDAVASVQCQLDSGAWLPCTTQTSQTYSALAGGAHAFAVRATDAAGNASTATYGWSVTAPVNTSPPSISGTPAVGSTLNASPGSWTGTPTFAYQWLRCDSGGANCEPIGGASASSYTAVAADTGATLAVQVTATTSAGSSARESNATTAVSGAPANTAPPTISGSATEGQTLTASPGSWRGSPAPSFAYQWQRCDQSGLNCSPVTGANSSTYAVTSSDGGFTLLVTVEATNASGSAQASSAATTTVPAAPANTTAPTISGSATPGQTLSASPG